MSVEYKENTSNTHWDKPTEYLYCITCTGNSFFWASQTTLKVRGRPWNEALCGKMDRAAVCSSSTLTMYRSAMSRTRSMFSRLADLPSKHCTALWFVHTRACYKVARYKAACNFVARRRHRRLLQCRTVWLCSKRWFARHATKLHAIHTGAIL